MSSFYYHVHGMESMFFLKTVFTLPSNILITIFLLFVVSTYFIPKVIPLFWRNHNLSSLGFISVCCSRFPSLLFWLFCFLWEKRWKVNFQNSSTSPLTDWYLLLFLSIFWWREKIWCYYYSYSFEGDMDYILEIFLEFLFPLINLLYLCPFCYLVPRVDIYFAIILLISMISFLLCNRSFLTFACLLWMTISSNFSEKNK